jgi:starch synthase
MAATRSALIIGSEAVPFAKTGGLADVLGALPSALARLGWDVTLVLPRYRGVGAGALIDRFSLTVGGYTRDVGFFEAPLPGGARAVLVDCPDLYDRDELYAPRGAVGYPDNARRFAVLARAAFEWTARRGQRPSVVHGHDWQAGLAPVYLRTLYASHPILAGTPSVFTIHNLAYQGLFEPDWLPRVGLGPEELAVDRLEFWGQLSFLKGGIRDSAVVTTVSRTYADEIQTPEFGFGFDGILRDRRHDLVGILNGIDTSEWDPRHDRFLPAPYGPDALDGKIAAKRAVLARYRLPDDAAAIARPLVGMISRMVDQKGFDLIEDVAADLSRLDATFVVLGTGDARYQDLWTGLAAKHSDRIAAHIGFDEGLAHLIEGGADMFLMPSRFEPCGLNQMYSLRYGTVPVVRAVGGLADTVRDYAPGDMSSTGFVFTDYTGRALLEALGRALALFRDPARWRAVQRAAMREDNSWDQSAQEYVRIYERAIERGLQVRG